MIRANSPATVRRAFDRALEDGRVSDKEARRIARSVEKDGVGGRELRALHGQLDRHEDKIDRRGLRRLDDVGSELVTNSTAAVRNNARVFAADGEVSSKDAREILAGVAGGGVKKNELKALERALGRDDFAPDAAARVRAFVDQVRAAPPRTQPARLDVDGVPLHTNGSSQRGILAAQAAIGPKAAALRRAGVEVVIVPHDKALTDLPGFAGLKGAPGQFPGETLDDVRGGTLEHKGRRILVLSEEQLAGLPGDVFGEGPRTIPANVQDAIRRWT